MSSTLPKLIELIILFRVYAIVIILELFNLLGFGLPYNFVSVIPFIVDEYLLSSSY